MAKLECQKDYSTFIRQGFHMECMNGCDTGSSVTPTGYIIVETTIDLDEKRVKCQVWCKEEEAGELQRCLKDAFEDYIREVCDIFKQFTC